MSADIILEVLYTRKCKASVRQSFRARSITSLCDKDGSDVTAVCVDQQLRNLRTLGRKHRWISDRTFRLCSVETQTAYFKELLQWRLEHAREHPHTGVPPIIRYRYERPVTPSNRALSARPYILLGYPSWDVGFTGRPNLAACVNELLTKKPIFRITNRLIQQIENLDSEPSEYCQTTKNELIEWLKQYGGTYRDWETDRKSVV